VADWATLHEDDGVVPILPSDRGGQPENELGFGASGDALEADCGQMMTFIDDEMPVLGDEVVDFAIPNQALDHCDVDDAARLALAATNHANLIWFNLQE
jgi:hypothetical protein